MLAGHDIVSVTTNNGSICTGHGTGTVSVSANAGVINTNSAMTQLCKY